MRAFSGLGIYDVKGSVTVLFLTFLLQRGEGEEREGEQILKQSP